MRKPANLTAIIIWEFTSAFIALLALCAVSIFFAFPEILEDMGSSAALPGAVIGFSIAILLLICYIVIAISAAIGLLKGSEWGRVLSIVHSACSLLSIPVGTAIGIMIIMYLTKAEVKNYFQGIVSEEE